MKTRLYRCSDFRASDIANLAVWLRADKGVTEAGGVITSVVNYGSLGGTFTPVGAGADVTLGSLRGKPAFQFNGGKGLQSGLAASSFKFLHDGTGCSVYLTGQGASLGTTIVFDTGNYTGSGANGVGTSLAYSTVLRQYTSKGSAPFILQAAGSNAGSRVTGMPWNFYWMLIHGSARNLDAWRSDSGVCLEVDYAAAPSASNPSGPLTVGCDVSGASPWTGLLNEIAAYTDIHTDVEVERWELYFAEEFGLSPSAGY